MAKEVVLKLFQREKKKHSIIYSGVTEGGIPVSFYIPNDIVEKLDSPAMLVVRFVSE